jgi:hypothetical protein
MPSAFPHLRPVHPLPVILSIYAIGIAFILLGWLNHSVGQTLFGLIMAVVATHITVSWIFAKRKDAESDTHIGQA